MVFCSGPHRGPGPLTTPAWIFGERVPTFPPTPNRAAIRRLERDGPRSSAWTSLHTPIPAAACLNDVKSPSSSIKPRLSPPFRYVEAVVLNVRRWFAMRHPKSQNCPRSFVSWKIRACHAIRSSRYSPISPEKQQSAVEAKVRQGVRPASSQHEKPELSFGPMVATRLKKPSLYSHRGCLRRVAECHPVRQSQCSFRCETRYPRRRG